MDISWIITPLSGAVIGYFTNWLAVKMLFRPHTEKRLFGMRVPMTPGLIPKEKARLAQKVGETLAKNVLTEKELVAALSHPEVTAKLTALFDGFLSGLSEGAYAEQTERALRAAADKIAAFIENGDGGMFGGVFAGLKDRLLERAAAYLKSESFITLAEGFAADLAGKLADNGQALKSYLPEGLSGAAERLMDERFGDIITFLKSLPERFPDVDERLRGLVQKIAEDNFGSFLGVFIRYDQIYGKIKNSLFNYLDESGNQAFIKGKVAAWISGALDKPVGELYAKLPENIRDEAPASLAGLVRSGMEGGAADRLLAGIGEKTKSVNLADALRRVTPDIPGAVYSVLKAAADAVLRSAAGENAANLRERAVALIKTAAEKGGAYVITSMRFDRLIEKKINEFSVEEAEEIIVSVVDRELKSITWLGGVLGLVIGFVPLITRALGLG